MPAATAIRPKPQDRPAVEKVQQPTGYTIVLKGGTKILAKEKFQENGSLARYREMNGTQFSLPMDRIDIPATELANRNSQ